MGCGTCSSGGGGCATGGGCSSNNGCKTGGCNRLNVFDWLSNLPFSAQQDTFNIIEVSFKNGSRKGFYRNINNLDCNIGDMIVVEAPTGGFDIGKVSLGGELVRLQMKKKRQRKNAEIPRILRIASKNDLENWKFAVEQEYNTMLMARVLAKDLKLNMKIGDVEYQGDSRKATFYYTADERIDFRELIKAFAKEFHVKIEMRQIGVRLEASRIGGLGTCGRELCCSTWLTDFKSVNTIAARYQNLSINQSKLSGQCGRLKCCLNYELDSYLDALKDFPNNADFLETKKGRARLVKTDIFKRLMFYAIPGSGIHYPLDVVTVKKIQEMNKKGDAPEGLLELTSKPERKVVAEIQYEDLVGQISLDSLDKSDKKRKKKKRNEKERNDALLTSNQNTNTDLNENQAQNKNVPKEHKPNKNQPNKNTNNNPNTLQNKTDLNLPPTTINNQKVNEPDNKLNKNQQNTNKTEKPKHNNANKHFNKNTTENKEPENDHLNTKELDKTAEIKPNNQQIPNKEHKNFKNNNNNTQKHKNQNNNNTNITNQENLAPIQKPNTTVINTDNIGNSKEDNGEKPKTFNKHKHRNNKYKPKNNNPDNLNNNKEN